MTNQAPGLCCPSNNQEYQALIWSTLNRLREHGKIAFFSPRIHIDLSDHPHFSGLHAVDRLPLEVVVAQLKEDLELMLRFGLDWEQLQQIKKLQKPVYLQTDDLKLLVFFQTQTFGNMLPKPPDPTDEWRALAGVRKTEPLPIRTSKLNRLDPNAGMRVKNKR